MSDVRKSPLRPHDFIEVRMQSGAIYATVGLARMLRQDELPDMVTMLQRGLDAGRALAREAAATAAGAAAGAATAAEDVDSPDAPSTYAASPPEDYAKTCRWALTFWRTVLDGLAEDFSEFRVPVDAPDGTPARGLSFKLGEHTWLNVKPTSMTTSVVCVEHACAYGASYGIQADTSFDELRAFVLWLVRSAGFDAKAPPGWPDPPASETPPNNAGTLLWEEA